MFLTEVGCGSTVAICRFLKLSGKKISTIQLESVMDQRPSEINQNP
jgi:hypothetical protein